MSTKEVTVLLLNAGSSSLKAALFTGEKEIIRCYYDRLGGNTTFHAESFIGKKEKVELKLPIESIEHGVRHCIEFFMRAKIITSMSAIKAVIHRVVHGGEYYSAATIITPDVVEKIEALSLLAPLHNPHNLSGITTAQRVLPSIPHIAVFDTAYHQTLSEVAYRYGIPEEMYQKYKIRKYGFHGTSHKYLAAEAKRLTGAKRVITCHLGNGSSITANKDGKSVDTTMGFTPTDGLIMGTRSGAIDPEAVLYMLRLMHNSPAKLDTFLNKRSGLLGVSAYSGDVRDLWTQALKKKKKAILALEMLSYRIKKYIGAYDAILDGTEAIVFAGGIGENAWFIRELALDGLDRLGIKLDERKNQAAQNKPHAMPIHTRTSKVKILVIPAHEELQMVREAHEILEKLKPARPAKQPAKKSVKKATKKATKTAKRKPVKTTKQAKPATKKKTTKKKSAKKKAAKKTTKTVKKAVKKKAVKKIAKKVARKTAKTSKTAKRRVSQKKVAKTARRIVKKKAVRRKVVRKK